MDENNCEHTFIHLYCKNCGRDYGQECQECGMWYDGGDPNPVPDDAWCTCANKELVRDC